MKQAPELIPVQHLHTIGDRQNTGARKRHMTLRDGMLINDEVRSCDEQRGLLLLLMLPNKVNARRVEPAAHGRESGCVANKRCSVINAQ